MTTGELQILIADDDDGDRKQITRALKQGELNCQCRETPNIQDAIRLCEVTEFDCAFVDYQLPGQNGLQGITALHEIQPHMAIIMSTGRGDELIAADAIKRGASDYLPKSQITAESVRYIVENAIRIVTLQRKLAGQGEELRNFASVLVHDLKAPIRSIQTLIGFLAEEIRTNNLAAADEEMASIVSVTKRLEALIDTLNQYTLISGRISFASIDMNQIAKDTIANLSHLIQQREAKVSFSDLPTLRGNVAELVQLLQNLVANGIKYCTAPVPTVHISAAACGEGGWQVSVRDNGIGIAPRYLTCIFDPFRRLHSPSKFEGTGLGLATCKKIVERHGGKIWAESVEGEGTNFLFTLPATPPLEADQ